MVKLTVQLPDDLVTTLGLSRTELTRELRLVAAMHWYKQGALSHKQAAKVAGLDLTDFLLAIASTTVDSSRLELAQLRSDLDALRADLDDLKSGDVCDLQNDVSELRGDVADLMATVDD